MKLSCTKVYLAQSHTHVLLKFLKTSHFPQSFLRCQSARTDSRPGAESGTECCFHTVPTHTIDRDACFSLVVFYLIDNYFSYLFINLIMQHLLHNFDCFYFIFTLRSGSCTNRSCVHLLLFFSIICCIMTTNSHLMNSHGSIPA